MQKGNWPRKEKKTDRTHGLNEKDMAKKPILLKIAFVSQKILMFKNICVALFLSARFKNTFQRKIRRIFHKKILL